MAEEIKPIGIDTTGFELITNAVKDLLNQYPGLHENETILFEELSEDSGIAFSADNGALIMTETVDVTDHVKQTCQYPFYVVYRTASNLESQKLSIQTFLDNLGRWLCREPVLIDETEYRLKTFPDLAGGREIKKITRLNSYGLEPSADGVQDWLLPLTVQYTNEYDEV